MEFENGTSVEMRQFMFTLCKVAEEQGRLANFEDMERRGIVVASCGNLHCINRDHVRIVLDNEVGD